MVRIEIMLEAYEAIRATLPEGSQPAQLQAAGAGMVYI